MQAPTGVPEKKSSSRMPLIIGGCAVLLICVCCVGIVAAVTLVPEISSTVTGVLPSELQGLVSATATPTRGLAQPPGGLPPAQRTPGGVAPLQSPIAKPTVPPASQPGAGNLFGDALSKAKTAQKYRIEMAMLIGSTQAGKFAEEALLDMKGMVDGKNSSFEGKGVLMGMLSGGGAVEIVTVDGKTYMRGISMFGMTDPKTWYSMKDSSGGSGFEGFAKPDSYDSFMGDAKPADFKKVRTESVDGQSCDVYVYDLKNAKNAAITGLLGSAKDKQDFSAIDKYEMSMWLCGDGYVHKFALDMQGHDANNPAEKGSMKINAHMWDFNNAAIKITAPAGAKPFPGQ
jgi:hypothetical protein